MNGHRYVSISYTCAMVDVVGSDGSFEVDILIVNVFNRIFVQSCCVSREDGHRDCVHLQIRHAI